VQILLIAVLVFNAAGRLRNDGILLQGFFVATFFYACTYCAQYVDAPGCGSTGGRQAHNGRCAFNLVMNGLKAASSIGLVRRLSSKDPLAQAQPGLHRLA
jgi:hypothetical protein